MWYVPTEEGYTKYGFNLSKIPLMKGRFLRAVMTIGKPNPVIRTTKLRQQLAY